MFRYGISLSFFKNSLDITVGMGFPQTPFPPPPGGDYKLGEDIG